MLYFMIFLIILEIFLAVVIVRFFIAKTKKLKEDQFKMREKGKELLENLKKTRFSLAEVNPKLAKKAYPHKMSLQEVREFITSLSAALIALCHAKSFFSKGFIMSGLVMKILKERNNLVKTIK